MLDEAGFDSAARWYVDGYSQRSGIKVNLDFPPKLDRMHRDVEVALFRAVQESLTNIHKHSGAASVNICLSPTQSKFDWRFGTMEGGYHRSD